MIRTRVVEYSLGWYRVDYKRSWWMFWTEYNVLIPMLGEGVMYTTRDCDEAMAKAEWLKSALEFKSKVVTKCPA